MLVPNFPEDTQDMTDLSQLISPTEARLVQAAPASLQCCH